MNALLEFANNCRRLVAWLGVLLLIAPSAFADCARDSHGEVYCGGGYCVRDHAGSIWCSRFYKGGALLTRNGAAVCGRGQCESDTRGQIFCSAEVDGAVLKDSHGRVRCYGKCELAREAYCENTKAGVAN